MKKFLRIIIFIFLMPMISLLTVKASNYDIAFCSYGNYSNGSGYDYRYIVQNEIIYDCSRGESLDSRFSKGKCHENSEFYPEPYFSPTVYEKTNYDYKCLEYVYFNEDIDTDNPNNSKKTMLKKAYDKNNGNLYHTQDLECVYRPMGNDSLKMTVNIPGSYWGEEITNSGVTIKYSDGSTESTSSTKVSYLPIADAKEADLKYAYKWSDFSKAWTFIPRVTKEGCPTNLLYKNSKAYLYLSYMPGSASETGLAWEDSDYSQWELIKSESDTQCKKVDKAAIEKERDEYVQKKIMAPLEKYKKNGVNKYRKICIKNKKCKKDITNIKFLEQRYNKLLKKLEKYLKGTYTEALKAKNCSTDDVSDVQEELTKKLLDLYNEVLKKAIENGEITQDEADASAAEAEDNTLQLLVSFYYKNDSKLNDLIAEYKDKKTYCATLFGGKKDVTSVNYFVVSIVKIIKIIIPIVLILLGSIDLSKVVISNDKEAMPKALSQFIKRVIIAVAIFLLPHIVDSILIIFNSAYTTDEKMNCILEDLR